MITIGQQFAQVSAAIEVGTRTSPTPVAVRVARHRARRRSGLAVFQIEADEVALADALVTAGLLSSDKADDGKALSAALRHAVEIFVQSNSL